MCELSWELRKLPVSHFSLRLVVRSRSGRANKSQVAEMVKRLLSLDEIPKPVDSTDALALAICHLWRGGANDKYAEALKVEKARLAALVKR
jgi:crossover junction endodeoxyribonuclease RuvC